MPIRALDRRRLLHALGLGGAALACGRASAAVEGAAGAPITQGYASSRVGQVYYRMIRPAPGQQGLKTPLLCLHAGPGSSRNYLDLMPRMATDRWVIAADTPGYGLSQRPATPSTIADFAQAASAVVDALGLGRIDVLGNHTSTATALELARMRPGLVRRIVLNSALMYTPQERAERKAAQIANATRDLSAAVDTIPARWRAFRQATAHQSEEQSWGRFWEVYRDPTHQDWGFVASYDYDFAATLAQTRAPVLILNPQDVLHDITARAAGKGPDVRIAELPWPGGTFDLHVDAVTQVIRAFLDT
ncbi:alpha/beta fold hydrolase [Novosphingobium sp. FSY-8]|uniref:Alpha/beta fold hydrolase n=1 Tax=Novosphingobium ovatum TaxID=1908523 RepID=A0ABW9XE95_9SPHN|nr:alpha/beta fold hydrolase [Novosphingobium ovatum]NBC36860.1 alpha/beta fold hydrolase [Novosphingobium ovatum]